MGLATAIKRPLKRRLYRHVARRAFRPEAEPPILIYQVGKVGSSTVFESLRRAGLARRVFHVHVLSEDTHRHRAVHMDAGASYPYHLDLGEALAAELQRTGKRCKIISLVRDPIAIKVSALFEVPEFAGKDVRRGSRGIDPARGAQELRRCLADPGFFEDVFEWFDREIKRVFSIDVFATPFPKERGAGLYRGEKADLLLLRLEDLSRIGPAALAEFIGLPAPLQLVSANTRAGTAEADEYRALLGQLRLERETCERIYSSRFAKHFYAPLELEAFTAKWTGA